MEEKSLSLETATSAVRSVQYSFRNGFIGKLKLRRGLPRPRKINLELAFYSKTLNAIPEELKTNVELAIDVGVRDWSYSSAVAGSFPEARLHAIEADAFRRYPNLHRRVDQMSAQARELKTQGRDVELFLMPDFEYRDRYFPSGKIKEKTCVLLLFPYLSANPCLAAGLPLCYAEFEKQVRGWLSVLGAGSSILSLHQGECEGQAAAKVYSELAGANQALQFVQEFECDEYLPFLSTMFLFTKTSID